MAPRVPLLNIQTGHYTKMPSWGLWQAPVQAAVHWLSLVPEGIFLILTKMLHRLAVPLVSFYRERSWCSERLSNLLKATQPAGDGARTKFHPHLTAPCWFMPDPPIHVGTQITPHMMY